MKYIVGMIAGILGSTLFWLLGTSVFSFPQSYLMVGMTAWFCAFGAGGFFSFRNVAPDN